MSTRQQILETAKKITGGKTIVQVPVQVIPSTAYFPDKSARIRGGRIVG